LNTSALAKAQVRVFTHANILAGFEATGISPFDTWQTPVMHEFRDRLHKSAEVTSEQLHVLFGPDTHMATLNQCAEVLKDLGASLEETHWALSDVLHAARGIEACNVIANEELMHFRGALKETKNRRAKEGLVVLVFTKSRRSKRSPNKS
jgi:hypothetical protein